MWGPRPPINFFLIPQSKSVSVYGESLLLFSVLFLFFIPRYIYNLIYSYGIFGDEYI